MHEMIFDIFNTTIPFNIDSIICTYYLFLPKQKSVAIFLYLLAKNQIYFIYIFHILNKIKTIKILLSQIHMLANWIFT